MLVVGISGVCLHELLADGDRLVVQQRVQAPKLHQLHHHLRVRARVGVLVSAWPAREMGVG